MFFVPRNAPVEIFSKDIQADVEKVLKNTPLNLPQMKNAIHIDLTKRPPWQTFDELQCKLHQLSMCSEEMLGDDVNKICTEIEKCITEHVLPDAMYKTIGDMTVHLVLLLSKWLVSFASEQPEKGVEKDS